MDIRDYCIPESQFHIHQLTKLDENCKEHDIFPVTLVQGIFDKSGVRLDTILASFNYVFLPFNGTKEATRLQVPLTARRKSLVVCYRDLTDDLYIEMYNFDKIDDESFQTDGNWVDFEQYVRMEIEKYYQAYIEEIVGNLEENLTNQITAVSNRVTTLETNYDDLLKRLIAVEEALTLKP